MNLKKRRTELGLTQGQLAKEVGVSLFTIRVWEQGITTPTIHNKAKLEEVLKKYEQRAGDINGESTEGKRIYPDSK